jgi:hypothetical protein
MVKVTPHRYSFDSHSWTFPDIGAGTALELYFVGDASTGYRAWPDSWVLDDRYGRSSSSLPGGCYGTDIRGNPDEVARWTDAQRAAEAALRDAEAQLLHDLGLMEVRHGNSRQLRGAPGWRALVRRSRGRRSERRALAEYRNRTGRIQEAYARVRDEIVARVREAQQQARERWELMHDVAARSRWRYEVDQAGGVVQVFREAEAPLDTLALADKLLEVRRGIGVAELRWSAEDRAEIERLSGVDFRTWWCAVTPRPWEDSRTIPPTRVDNSGRTVHVSAHTSFGVGISPPSAHF